MLGWLGVLGVVVGAAVLGGQEGEPRERVGEVAVVAVRPSLPPALAEFVVRGRVARDAGAVRIRLERADGAAVGTAPVDPTGHGHGDWVPFESRFVVERPDASSGAGLFVVAVGADGRALDAARPFSSALFLDVRAGEVARRRSLGNDGLVGGIVFGVPMEERHGP